MEWWEYQLQHEWPVATDAWWAYRIARRPEEPAHFKDSFTWNEGPLRLLVLPRLPNHADLVSRPVVSTSAEGGRIEWGLHAYFGAQAGMQTELVPAAILAHLGVPAGDALARALAQHRRMPPLEPTLMEGSMTGLWVFKDRGGQATVEATLLAAERHPHLFGEHGLMVMPVRDAVYAVPAQHSVEAACGLLWATAYEVAGLAGAPVYRVTQDGNVGLAGS